uniref:Uncharacterized protein n=1 Tax=Clytia hemisphaerica TaxID=252671 RepID=A0A7M5UXQ0_9CNID
MATLEQEINSLASRIIDHTKSTPSTSLHQQIAGSIGNQKAVLAGQIKQFDLGNGQTFQNPFLAAEELLKREYGETFLFDSNRHDPILIPEEFMSSQYSRECATANLDPNIMGQLKKDFGIKSSHDVLKEDKKLSAQPAVDENTLKRKDQQEDSASIARKKLKKEKEVLPPQKEDLFRNKQKVENDEDEEEKKKAERRKALQEEAKQLKKELKSKTSSFTDADPKQEKDDRKKKKEPINDLMKQLTEERDQYKNKKKKEKLLRKGDDRQAETLALLQSFQSSIASKMEENSTNNDNETNEEEDDDDEGWLTHKLEFEKDPELSGAKDANMKGDDWYDIYDPRNPMNQRRREEK